MLKNFSVLLVAATAVFSCSAIGLQRDFVKSHAARTNVFKAKVTNQLKPEAKVFPQQQMPRFNVSAEAVMHTVTLKAIYNIEDFESPWSCGIQNQDVAQYPYFNENGIATIEVPEGVYCASVQFDPSDEGSMERKIPRMVFVEDIVVDRDVTVELNVETATCLVEFQPLLPNGEVMTLPKYGDYNFETGAIDVTPGNTKEIASLDIVWHEEFGSLRQSGQSSNYTDEYLNIYDNWSLYINPVSDKISILRGVVASTADDGYYLTLMKPIKGIQESQEGDWSIDYSSRYTISTAHTDMFDKISETAWKYIPKSMLTIDFVCPDGEKFFMPFSVDSNGFEIRGAGLFSENQLLRAALTGGETDAAIEYWEKDEEGNDVMAAYNYALTFIPAFFFTEDGGQYFTSLPMDAGLIATEELPSDFGTPNEWYSFYNTEFSGEFGNSQPIACMNWRPQFDYEFDYETFETRLIRSNILFNTPVGRLSDVIGGNNMAAEVMISTLDSDKYWDDPDRTDKSRVELNATFSCQTIDGIQGKTDLYVYWDENNEDQYPPMLTMLQFRDAATGIVTDRFESANSAKAILSGNDFNVRIVNEDTYPIVLFDEAPAEIKLEWRATGAAEDTEWTQLDLTDLDCDIRGFGRMYEASLESVDGISASGWFDVRISMIDEAGNNMHQTVSPAFKIMSTVSVNEIGSDSESLQYYDLQGRSVKNPNPGLYIVRSGDKVYKKMVQSHAL